MSAGNNVPSRSTDHPSWCSPDKCEVRPEHPGFGDHRSEETIIVSRTLEPKIIVWLSQFGYEPPVEASVWVRMRFVEERLSGEIDQLATWDVPLKAARHLGAILAELATTGGVSS